MHILKDTFAFKNNNILFEYSWKYMHIRRQTGLSSSEKLLATCSRVHSSSFRVFSSNSVTLIERFSAIDISRRDKATRGSDRLFLRDFSYAICFSAFYSWWCERKSLLSLVNTIKALFNKNGLDYAFTSTIIIITALDCVYATVSK